jgi:RNA-directed DNA polymerase
MTLDIIEQLEQERFLRSGFRGLRNIHQLANILQEPVTKLRYFANHSKKYYREYDQVVNANNKRRHIEEPLGGLKALQKKIAQHCMQNEQLPPYLSSPAPNRSIITNAAAHRNRVKAAKTDIHNFFGNCRASRIFRLFQEHSCSPEICDILTNILCYKGHLPTGAPSSPIMAFFAYERMFNEIYIAVGDYRVRMSLWIDDLMFSCMIENMVDKQLFAHIEIILHTHGCRLNRRKNRLYQSDQAALFAGIILMPNGERRTPNKLHKKWYTTKEAYKAAPANSEQKTELKQIMDGLKNFKQDIQKSNKRWKRRSLSH